MGRAKMNTQQIVCRIDCDLIDKLKSINPSLLTTDTVKGQLKFRHGALGRYIARLIADDIERREKQMKDDVLRRFM